MSDQIRLELIEHFDLGPFHLDMVPNLNPSNQGKHEKQYDRSDTLIIGQVTRSIKSPWFTDKPRIEEPIITRDSAGRVKSMTYDDKTMARMRTTEPLRWWTLSDEQKEYLSFLVEDLYCHYAPLDQLDPKWLERFTHPDGRIRVAGENMATHIEPDELKKVPYLDNALLYWRWMLTLPYIRFINTISPPPEELFVRHNGTLDAFFTNVSLNFYSHDRHKTATPSQFLMELTHMMVAFIHYKWEYQFYLEPANPCLPFGEMNLFQKLEGFDDYKSSFNGYLPQWEALTTLARRRHDEIHLHYYKAIQFERAILNSLLHHWIDLDNHDALDMFGSDPVRQTSRVLRYIPNASIQLAERELGHGIVVENCQAATQTMYADFDHRMKLLARYKNWYKERNPPGYTPKTPSGGNTPLDPAASQVGIIGLIVFLLLIFASFMT